MNITSKSNLKSNNIDMFNLEVFDDYKLDFKKNKNGNLLIRPKWKNKAIKSSN